MLEKLLSIPSAFPFAFGKVGCGHRNSQSGNVGWDHSECSNVSRLGLTHLEERIVYSEVVIVYTFALTLGELREVSGGDLSCVPWLIAGQKLVLDGVQVVSGDACVLYRVPPNDGPVAEDQVDLRKFTSIVPVCDARGGFDSVDEQSFGDCILVFSTEEQWHLRGPTELIMPLEGSSHGLLLGGGGHLLLLSSSGGAG